jgi:uncharacterized membrane protein YqaE (UPF0057 family)
MNIAGCSNSILFERVVSTVAKKHKERDSAMPRTNKLLLVIIAILLPPLAVYLETGAGKHFIINIILCIFFYLPGIIHALWLVLK